jgi:hypothetical protein
MCHEIKILYVSEVILEYNEIERNTTGIQKEPAKQAL